MAQSTPAGDQDAASPPRDATALESDAAAKADPAPAAGRNEPVKERKRKKLSAREQENARLVELETRLLRLQADFENYRKRTLREKEELYVRANEELVLDLLPVLDHMDLALAAARKHEAPDAFVEGFRLVSEQMRSTLGRFGLRGIDVVGAAFDPNTHEAVSHLPSDEIEDHHVMVEARRGYMLGDRLLRAAQVVVSSGSASGAASGTGEG